MLMGLTAENNMHRAHVIELKGQVAATKDELHMAKRKLLDIHKRNQKLKEKQEKTSLSRPQSGKDILIRPVARSRFVGGGFNMVIPSGEHRDEVIDTAIIARAAEASSCEISSSS